MTPTDKEWERLKAGSDTFAPALRPLLFTMLHRAYIIGAIAENGRHIARLQQDTVDKDAKIIQLQRESPYGA